MGSTSIIITTFLVVQLAVFTIGTASYRQYKILSGNYYNIPPSYYNSDKTYYVNPYANYGYTNPSSSYSTSYTNSPYEGNVYITDKYGQTTLVSGSRVRSQYGRAQSYPSRLVCGTGNCGQSSAYYTYPNTGGCSSGNCGQLTGYSYPTDIVCNSGTCGQNAHCSLISGRPVCSCLRGYIGDPLSHCTRAECLDDSECRSHLVCKNERCVNPCEGVCGTNADCEVRNHIPTCSCPPGHTGDPFSHCRVFNPEELCHPSPCGQNTQCEVINNVPTCKCLPGYHGSPLSGCRHECERDSECGSHLACIEYKCQNPCSQCGLNADCQIVRDHIPVCKCPPGYFGNALVSCQPECTQHTDCPRSKPACFYNSCKNPCDGVCGVNANCELKNGITPVCSCPKDMTGNPFESCRPFTPQDLCEPNPCGTNAKCTPGFDKYNEERPVCTCPQGYTGNALSSCIRGECFEDSECADNLGCINYRCQNPCIGKCGTNAMCNVRRHIAVCTCLPGYNGDSLTQCYQVESHAVRTGGRCLSCY